MVRLCTYSNHVLCSVQKGLKGTPVIPDSTFNFVEAHLWTCLGILFLFWTVLMYILASLKVKILNIAVLAGTFALALAFAGNDLVNFIGVSVAGYDSYSAASAAVSAGIPAASVGSNLLMSSLAAPVKANPLMLFAAGIIMAVTIWTSKKARHVTDTDAHVLQHMLPAEYRRHAASRGQHVRRHVQLQVPCDVHLSLGCGEFSRPSSTDRTRQTWCWDTAVRGQFSLGHAVALYIGYGGCPDRSAR